MLLKTSQRTEQKSFTIATGVLAYLLGMAWAFPTMLLVYWLKIRLERHRE